MRTSSGQRYATIGPSSSGDMYAATHACRPGIPSPRRRCLHRKRAPQRATARPKSGRPSMDPLGERTARESAATDSVRSAVRERATEHGWKLVEVETTAVHDPDVVVPIAGVTAPVIADVQRHAAVLNRRVGPVEPARGVRTARVDRRCCLRHLRTRAGGVAIPAGASPAVCVGAKVAELHVAIAVVEVDVSSLASARAPW